MLAPDLQFMVHSAEIVDEEGFAHRGSRLTLIEKDPRTYPEWKMKDFAFAAYSSAGAAGLKKVYFGLRAVWAFASPREHCQELVVFRKGADTRKKWDEDKMHDPNKGLDMFFIMLCGRSLARPRCSSNSTVSGASGRACTSRSLANSSR
jgi:hypothetical protein